LTTRAAAVGVDGRARLWPTPIERRARRIAEPIALAV